MLNPKTETKLTLTAAPPFSDSKLLLQTKYYMCQYDNRMKKYFIGYYNIKLTS